MFNVRPTIQVMAGVSAAIQAISHRMDNASFLNHSVKQYKTRIACNTVAHLAVLVRQATSLCLEFASKSTRSARASTLPTEIVYLAILAMSFKGKTAW